jgi:serine palmitoyltransferase
MDLQHALSVLNSTIDEASTQFRRVPGSSILLRYIKNSYQNDPIRSVVELCLFLFAVRYLLAPRYSTKQKSMDLTEEVRLDPSCRSTFHEGRLIPRVGDRRAS